MVAPEGATTSGPAVASGSRVVLIVSRGPSPEGPSTGASMPGIKGKQQGDALEELENAGLNTQVFTDYDNVVHRGHIIDQFPLPGAGVAAGSEAAVLVSSGPTQQTGLVGLPDVVGLSEADAILAVRSAGLEPEVARDFHPNVAEGVVLAQLPTQSALSEEARRRMPLSPIWLLLGFMVVAIAAIGIFGISMLVGKQVAVPNLTGMSQAQAQQTLGSSGLRLGPVTTQSGSDAAEGTVISQSPQAGATVRSGRLVAVVIAATRPKVAVPNVVGLSKSAASGQISSAGLVVLTTSQYSNSVAADTVISQSPAAGAQVDSGSTVNLVLSLGSQSSSTILPDLVGMSASVAASRLSALNLTSQSANAYSSTTAAGNVIDQVPAAGQSVALNNAVGLTISIGPAPSGADDRPRSHGTVGHQCRLDAHRARAELDRGPVERNGTAGQHRRGTVAQARQASRSQRHDRRLRLVRTVIQMQRSRHVAHALAICFSLTLAVAYAAIPALAQDASLTQAATLSQAATPTVTLKLQAPIAVRKSAAFTLRGTASAAASAGETVTITLARKSGGWSTVSTSTAVLSASRTFSRKLSAGQRGHWRITASLPATTTHLPSSASVQLKVVGKKVIALTFDDGPWPSSTAKIVAALKAGDAQATFFELGSQIGSRKKLSQSVIAGGNIIGVHSWNHAIMVRRSSSVNSTDLKRCVKAVKSATGTTPHWFRPPYGSTNKKLRAVAAAQGLHQVIWTIDTLDWKYRKTSSVLSRALKPARDGSVVLMHDGGGPRGATAAAVPTIIKRLRAKGFDFVTLDEMLALGYKVR